MTGPRKALLSVDHRPIPLPARPWIMAQRWHDLLFAHWPMPPAKIAPLVPAPLRLDTRDGSAWLGVVPFRMTGVRLRMCPPLPGLSAFCELNVRTYVSFGELPGVYFFSLDADSAIAVAVARAWFGLPYLRARMSLRDEGGEIAYASVRRGGAPAEFTARYAADGDARAPVRGSLEHWLVERYCLFTAGGGRARRVDIHHLPWQLAPARAEIRTNTMAAALGLALPDEPPLLHFAANQEIAVWAPTRPSA